MRGWPHILICLLYLCIPSAVLGGTLVVYDSPPLPEHLHPFLLLGSRQGVRLSGLTTERASRIDAMRVELELGLFDKVEKRSEREYLLTLRPELKWSDGSALVAADVAASLSRLQQMAAWDNPPLEARILVRSLFLLERFEVVDERQVRAIFRKPVQPTELPAIMAMLPIIPAKLTDEELSAPGALGCGPFTVESVDESKIVMKANPHYYLGKPAIDVVEYRVADDEAIGKALFAGGSGDIAVFVPVEQLETIKRRPDLITRPTKSRRMLYLGFNRREGSRFARTPELRMVLASIINVTAIEDTVPDGGLERIPLTGPYSSDGPYADQAVVPTPISSPLAARRLSELGFRRIGETYRDGGNKALSFRLLVYKRVPNGELIAKVIGEQLERMGIGLDIKVIDAAALETLLEEPRGDFDLILHEWVLDEGEDIYEIYHSEGLYNFLGYANVRVSERLVLERRAALPRSRVLYRHEIHRLFNQDMPALFMWEQHDVVVFRADIDHVPPLDPYFIFRDVQLWTVGEDGSS